MTPDTNNTDTNNTQMRLTDEQFCELLTGRACRETLADPADEAQADALQSSLASYRTETLLWAERRSAAMPSLADAARRSRWMAAIPQWSLAAVAVMTVAIGLAHVNNGTQGTASVDSSAITTQTIEAKATPQQISADNALLNSIDAALNTDTGLSEDALGLRSPREPHHHGSVE